MRKCEHEKLTLNEQNRYFFTFFCAFIFIIRIFAGKSRCFLKMRYFILPLLLLFSVVGLRAQQAPDFNVQDMRGEVVSLSALRGKYVVLDFWGAWCPACMKEIPSLKKLYKKHHDDLEIISVNCFDEGDEWQEVVEDYHLKWPQLKNTSETDLVKKFDVRVFPTKLLLDREGKILFRLSGEHQSFFTKVSEILKKK